jgi:hypothetical protein
MDWPLFSIGMTESWRKGRKLLDRSLRLGEMVLYRQMMQEKAREFLAQLRADPKDFRAHVQLLQGKFIMSLTYGYDLKDGDKILEAPVQVSKIMVRLGLPGAALINQPPILRYIPSWVPYFSYEPLAKIVRKLSVRIRNEPLDFVKNALVRADRTPSLRIE